MPSRQACLDGVEAADAYVLLLGEYYGDPLPDTGKAPTEEEFTVAKRRGIPVLAFRKRGVKPEPAQADFIKRIEDYATGVFRDGFADAAELLPQVASAIRDLDSRPPVLAYEPLASAVSAPWQTFASHGWRSTATIVELIAIPTAPATLPASVLSALPARLSRIGREHGLFDDSMALDSGATGSAAHAATRPDRNVPIAGVGMAATGTLTIWREMPSDMLGVILDRADLAGRISTMLRLAGELLPTGSVALAIGLHGLGSVTEGSAADLGRRNSASMAGFGYDKAALVEPRDSISAAVIPRAAEEIAAELAMRLIFAFRDAVR